jgi:hypothetical protein
MGAGPVTCAVAGCGLTLVPGRYGGMWHDGHPPPASLPHYPKPTRG